MVLYILHKLTMTFLLSRCTIYALLLAVIYFTSFVGGQMKECQQESSMMKSNALRLKKDLLCGYDRTIRPVIHHTNKTTVFVSLSPRVFYMDERYHSLGISCVLGLSWTDEFLKWSPGDYDGLDNFFFDSNTIWVPDINTISVPNRKSSVAVTEIGLSSNGEVHMADSVYFGTHCALDYTYWPHDSQICTLTLSTTSYYWPYIDLQIVKNSEEERKLLYRKKGPWMLTSMTSSRQYAKVQKDVYAVTLTYLFTIQRHATLYNSAITTAALVLPFLVLCTFWLDPRCTSRLNLCIIVLISHIIHLENLTIVINNIGDIKPVIVIHCQWCVFLAALCLIFTIVSRIISELPTCPYLLHQLSSWIYSNRYAQNLLLVDITFKNENEGSEDESSLVIHNTSFIQQWKILAMFIDRISFIVYFIFYVLLYTEYFPG